MQEDVKITQRTLTISAWMTVIGTLLLYGAGQSAWAWGYLIGALLSMFCTFSLMVLIPILFRPGGSRNAQGMSFLILYIKLPVYMLALYLVTNVKGISAGASVYGICIVPFVLTMKALGAVLKERLQASGRFAWTERRAEAKRRETKGAVAPQRQPAREGVG